MAAGEIADGRMLKEGGGALSYKLQVVKAAP